MKKLLVIVIILGGFVRFYHVNWDSYGAFHPDERNISWAVTRIKFFDQLNPKFFAYGGLPIYLYRAIGEGVVRLTRNQEWLSDWGHIAVLGRAVSAILSTVSIYLIFLVGSLYFSRTVGVVSAALLATSSWAIREAHFATTETMLVFFVLLMLLLVKRKRWVLFGIVWGLALAAKTTSALFGVIALTVPRRLVIILPVAILVFFLFSPYTLLDFQHFRESMTYETGVALGRTEVPYTYQFTGTIPYVYQFITMLWQAGPLVLAGFVGLVGLVKQKKYWGFLVFPLLYFAWMGSWYAKFARYNVLLLPFLTLAAAWVIRRSRVLTALTILVTAVWGLMNFSVFVAAQTRTTASDWMYANIPAGSTIYTEHWNDGLPLDSTNGISFKRELLLVYDEDTPAKKQYYATLLAKGDFIILSTRRMWATFPKLQKKYPLTSPFYAKLLDGNLGYTEVATFTSYPRLFGFIVNDDTAEESVQVFDHPTVRIFQNTGKLTKDALLSAL